MEQKTLGTNEGKNNFKALSPRTELVDGKKRIINIRTALGEYKTKDAVLEAMGKGHEYEDKQFGGSQCQK